MKPKEGFKSLKLAKFSIEHTEHVHKNEMHLANITIECVSVGLAYAYSFMCRLSVHMKSRNA
jgi:hypothetical protein